MTEKDRTEREGEKNGQTERDGEKKINRVCENGRGRESAERESTERERGERNRRER